MIYECAGLPGSGKSTLIQALSERLEIENTKQRVKQIGTDSFGAVSNNSKLVKISVKIFRVIQPLKPTNWHFFLICMRFFIKKLKSNSDFNGYKSNYETFIAILYCTYLFDEYRKNKDIIVSDEGLLQGLTSLALKSDSGFEDIIQLIQMQKYIKDPITHIYCKLNFDEAINRIKLRNRKTAAFDQISVDKLTDYLQNHKEMLESLISKDSFSKKIDVDMSESTNNTVQQIIRKSEKLV